MKANYEDLWYEGKLYADGELINDYKELEALHPVDRSKNVYIEFNKRYHFYETPWEKDDRMDITIEIDGNEYLTRGTFRNKTRTFIIWYPLEKI